MSAAHPVGQQIAEFRLRPAVHDELGDEMEVGARIDVVRDAARDNRQDRGRSLATDVEPGKQPILSSQNKPTELALATIMPRPRLCRVDAEQHVGVGISSIRAGSEAA